MKPRSRVYDAILAEHLAAHRQMALVTGPRQVGKTTTARKVGTHYLDWDNLAHQRLVLKGPEAVAEHCGLAELAERPPVVVFDELHKFARWKNFLKGFFDTYGNDCRIVVTGSSRLDVYRRGGDSLMGRYFIFRMHPFSVGELARQKVPDKPVRSPVRADPDAWDALWLHGGFPEPFLKADERFTRRWNTLRQTQLFKEELRDLTRVQELGLLEILGRLLAERSGNQVVAANLAREVQVAPNTVKAWINALCSFHYGFLVRPWYRNVAKALRKEPKWFLRDWAGLTEAGQRAETFVACHLLKATQGWTDLGLGQFELHYLRDKQKREVDFLVARDGQPWFLVEVKLRSNRLSPDLEYFQEQTGARHAFQVVIEKEFVGQDCFKRSKPVIVPARTFLSQLL